MTQAAKKAPLSSTMTVEDKSSLTPMMQQYMDVKEAHADCLVFYRMGDFYEMFFEDAVKASAALDIALTKRGKKKGVDIPMCGVPVHAYETYLSKLIRAGFRVAICEQIETPAQAKARGGYKALVKRDVVRIITPGTITEDNLLNARQNNYLTALAVYRSQWALAWVDLSTGTLFVQSLDKTDIAAAMTRLNPCEVIIPQSFEKEITELTDLSDDVFTPQVDTRFDAKNAHTRLTALFNVKTLDSYGDFSTADLSALGILIDYIELTQKGNIPRLSPPVKLANTSLMRIDGSTRRNLELNQTLQGERRGSVLDTIDRCVTGAGARLLSNFLNMPLTNPEMINDRLDQIEWFINQNDQRLKICDHLKQCPDLERALTRISLGRGGPRDLAVIRDGLRQAKIIQENMVHHKHKSEQLFAELPNGLKKSYQNLDINTSHVKLVATLDQALKKDLPLLTRDGGFIAKGYDATLDEFVRLRDDSKRIIASLQKQYSERTGINTLKIKHNNVLGYFVDITPTHLNKISNDDFFIHRQTLANAVRFTTVELSDLDKKISEANFKATATELEIFQNLSEKILKDGHRIALTAKAIATIDCMSGLANLAIEQNYCRPVIDDSLTFDIQGGRHVVVEHVLKQNKSENQFIANNCNLNTGHSLWLLTGPNMAGKSTFLRQNALITLMAQMGSYVPASSAHIGVVDRLFSRVGAADDLARGQSTFMVEMVETATILNQATERSLVILDEIGRGTATFDGLSIAWGTIEHLHDVNKSRGLFATHYHELTDLTNRLDNLSCHTMRVKEWQNDIIFLHQVEPGMANRSYGIHVARLAGIPNVVIQRAENILHRIETGKSAHNISEISEDLPLFSTLKEKTSENPTHDKIVSKLETINPDLLTPRDALDILYDLKKDI